MRFLAEGRTAWLTAVFSSLGLGDEGGVPLASGAEGMAFRVARRRAFGDKGSSFSVGVEGWLLVIVWRECQSARLGIGV